jgi:hypothetical protein
MSWAVGVFHAYAHSRVCQLEFNPRMIPGFGLEDLECCERLFQLTNSLAPTTRQASLANRHYRIEEKFALINRNRTEALGKCSAVTRTLRALLSFANYNVNQAVSYTASGRRHGRHIKNPSKSFSLCRSTLHTSILLSYNTMSFHFFNASPHTPVKRDTRSKPRMSQV